MDANIVTPTSSISDLNNDCLREILQYIEVNERAKLRMVCKAWCIAVDDLLREVRSVTIINASRTNVAMIKNEITGTNKDLRITAHGPLGNKLIAWVMEHCGDVITELQEEKTNLGQPFALKHCSNIEKLVTTVRTNRDDRNVSQIIANNEKLRIIDLEFQFKGGNLCFSNIPTENLEVLILKVPSNAHSTVALIGQKEVIPRCSSSLKEFSTDYFDDELVELIGQKIALQNLHLKFSFDSRYVRVTDRGFPRLLNLRNLRNLKLEWYSNQPTITDDFLMAVSENLPLLEVINIQASLNVTDRGFKSLAALEMLRELNIPKCVRITDEFLVLFSGLEALGVRNCSVRDEGVIKLLEKAVTMQHLDLYGTLISDATLVAAAEATKKRNNEIVLKLYIGSASAQVHTSPLLNIIYTSSFDHRPFG